MTHQVQQGAFGGEQSAGAGLQSQQGLPGLQSGAVRNPIQHPVAVGSEDFVEHHQPDVDPSGHAGFSGHDRRLGHRVDGHGGEGGDVRPVSQVFVQSPPDRLQRLKPLVGGQRHDSGATAAGWS